MYVINGIRDYIKDCWHDWHLHYIERSIGNEPLFSMGDKSNEWNAMIDWKEGSVWHYIRQRRIAKRMKHGKQSDVQSIK